MEPKRIIDRLAMGNLIVGGAIRIDPKTPKAMIKLVPVIHIVDFQGMSGPWGEEVDIALDHIRQAVENFPKYLEGRVLMDFDHQSLFYDGTTEARGWITAVEARDDGLYGVPEYTEETLAAIRAGKWLFLSPVFSNNYYDSNLGMHVGARLCAVAITNDPLLNKEIPAIAARTIIEGKESGMDLLKEIIAAMKLAAGTTAEQALAAVKKISEDHAPLAARATEIEANSKLLVAAKANGEILDAVRNELKLASVAGVPEYLAAIKDRSATAEQLAARVQTLESAQKKSVAEQLVEKAMLDGKIAAANRAWAIEFAEKDADGFSKWAAAAPKTVPVAGPINPVNQNPDGTLTAEEKRIAAMMGVPEATVVASKAQHQTA